MANTDRERVHDWGVKNNVVNGALTTTAAIAGGLAATVALPVYGAYRGCKKIKDKLTN